MQISQEFRRQGRQVVLPVICVAAFVYFSYHAIQGDRGLLAYMQLTAQLQTANSIAQHVEARRHALQSDVVILRTASLDRDMLEERARAVLDLIHPDEFVILTGDLDGRLGGKSRMHVARAEVQ